VEGASDTACGVEVVIAYGDLGLFLVTGEYGLGDASVLLAHLAVAVGEFQARGRDSAGSLIILFEKVFKVSAIWLTQ